MSSSSIEVMGGEGMKMVLIGEDQFEKAKEDNQIMDKPSDGQQEFGMEDEEEELQEPDHTNSPGSIIFSPQDLATHKVKSNRGRKKQGTALSYRIGRENSGNLDIPIACEICYKVIPNSKVYAKHMALHSGQQPFQCPRCPKTFTRLTHLQAHLAYHGIDKQFQCPICYQRFSRQDCVKVHMRLHDKTKCVYCDVCHKAFLTIGALNIHQRIHRGEKPFKCHLCGKCFTQKNHVITHIKRHTKLSEGASLSKRMGPRMFKCEHCPRSFIRLSDYERHVQWNHGAVSDTQLMNKYKPLSALDISPKVRKDMGPHFAPRSKSRFPKVMRTTGTQTDMEGGHVIIPRQYQSSGTSMVNTSTQVSAPNTPRGHDDEMYECDIFDEGMDRNYSSDEEEEEEGTFDAEQYKLTHTASGETVENEAFDAVFSGIKIETEREEDKDQSEELNTANVNKPIADEENVPVERPQNIAKVPQPVPEPKEIVMEKNLLPKIQSMGSTFNTQQKIVEKAKHFTKEVVLPKKILQSFNMGNWKGRRTGCAKGRGRGKVKPVMGLSGATHLRLIRKSMMNLISDKGNDDEAERVGDLALKNPAHSDQSPNEQEVVSNSRAKRQIKSKIHGKDFVCNSKSCKLCSNSVGNVTEGVTKTESKGDVIDPKEQVKPSDSKEQVKPFKSSKSRDQSVKLLKFLINGDASVLKGTDYKLLSDREDEFEYQITSAIPDSNADSSGMTSKYISLNDESSIVSPPVELQSFCIPTFSCKICGREFRFEGKLHRHIESIHQKKAIYSPDVKPGKGSLRYLFEAPVMPQLKEKIPVIKKAKLQNPEIEALRSEWDDDDEADENDSQEEDEEEMYYEDEEEEVQEMVVPSKTLSEVIGTKINSFAPKVLGGKYRPIAPKLMAPVSPSVSDVYISGVKVNLNKLSGLASEDNAIFLPMPPDSYAGMSLPTKEKEIKAPLSSLDEKCQKLLEKLFDMNLLLNCGINVEHVSVVLGKVLQHYGVKMIEDYGQGQYEVLKYNLWRLIEWKVTMEQMEEFYTEGKSVEEMMDDIMLGKVPIIAHHEPGQNASIADYEEPKDQEAAQPDEVEDQVQGIETVHISDNQLMLSQVANVLTGHLNLGEGVTQVVLAQDVSPELLQGAHIVTIDPSTGHVISQVAADQVILTSIGEETDAIVASVDSPAAASATTSTAVVSALPPGSIVAEPLQTIDQRTSIKLETGPKL